MVKTELAWVAGLFDGEGCTSLEAHHKWIRATVSQNHPGVLRRFQKAIGGGGSLKGPYIRKNSSKPYWSFAFGHYKSLEVLKLLWPYLSANKAIQALTKLDEIKYGS